MPITEYEHSGEGVHPHIDADAVCEQCGTVNPEDTLLCKTCGNNLRDQRARRIAEGRTAALPEGESHGEWLRRGLALFAILTVIWVALNVDDITGWLISIQTPSAAAQYWNGTASSKYESLIDELAQRPVGPSDLAAAQASTDPAFDGRYILMPRNDPDGRMLGTAAARREGDSLYFVAQFVGGYEVRGYAAIETNSRLTVTDSAGVKIRDKYYDVSGVGLKQGAKIDCMGFVAALEEASFSATAYRIPE